MDTERALATCDKFRKFMESFPEDCSLADAISVTTGESAELVCAVQEALAKSCITAYTTVERAEAYFQCLNLLLGAWLATRREDRNAN